MSGRSCAAWVPARTPAGGRRCGAATEAGIPCPQADRHVEPACPRCGRWRGTWHEQAQCKLDKRGCGYLDPAAEAEKGKAKRRRRRAP